MGQMIGPENRNTVENRLRELEGREILGFSSTQVQPKRYDSKRDSENPSMIKDNKVHGTATDTTISNEMEIEEVEPTKKRKNLRKNTRKKRKKSQARKKKQKRKKSLPRKKRKTKRIKKVRKENQRQMSKQTLENQS